MKRPLFWVLAASLAAVAAWIAWLGHPDFPLDDAYIVEHTVHGLLGSGETRFLHSSPLLGATSPVYILVVTLLAIVMPVAWAQLLACAGAILAYTCGTFILARREGVALFASLALSVFSIIAGMSVFHLLNGLETGLAMAAIIWTLIAFREATPRRSWHGVLLGVMPFIRPELGALSLLVFLRELVVIRRDGGNDRQLVPLLGWPVLGALIPVIFLLAAGASPIPNTTSAKVYFYAQGCMPAMVKMSIMLKLIGYFAGTLGLAAIGYAGLAISRYRAVSIAFIAIFIFAYYLRFPGGFYMNWARYPYLLAPLMLAGWIALLSMPQRRARMAAQLVFALAFVLAVATFPTSLKHYRDSIDYTRTELAGVTDWVATHIGKNETILVHDAGYISLQGEQPLVDLVGLKTPSSISAHRQYTWATCGRDPRAIATIARRAGAHYLVALTEWDQAYGLSASLRWAGWNVERVDGERGDSAYKVYRISPPPAAPSETGGTKNASP